MSLKTLPIVLAVEYRVSPLRTNNQKYRVIYDHLVQFTGCTSAPNTVECLRGAQHATPALTPNGPGLAWYRHRRMLYQEILEAVHPGWVLC